MQRTTTSRAVAVGALAATTALVLAAPSALAAPSPFSLDPGRSVLFTAVAVPVDPEQADESDATVVDLADGTVTVLLPGSAVGDAPTAALVTAEDYELSGEGELPPSVPLQDPLQPTVEGDLLTVVLPTDDPQLRGVDDASFYLLVSDLGVEGFEDAEPLKVTVPLELQSDLDGKTVPVPAAADASFLDARAVVDEPYAARAGETFGISLPGTSSLRQLGVESLDGLDGFLVPLGGDGDEDGVDLVLDSVYGASASAEGGEDVAAGLLGAAGVRALPELADDGGDGTTALDVEEVSAAAAEDDTATVRLADDLEAGSYLVVLFLASSRELVSVSVLGELELEAAAAPAPVPTPTVTVTAPTGTAPAPRQNPGLRSNTGVETGTVPGLSDGQLLGLGGGLLGLGVVAGAGVLRSQRRARA